MPIEYGFAAIGLADKYNSSAAIKETSSTADGFAISLSDGGKIAIYSEDKPAKVILNGNETDFDYNEKNVLMIINADVKGFTEIT